VFRSLNHVPVDGQNLIHRIQKRVEGWLDIMTAIESAVSVQDFLQHFRVRDQALAGAHQFFQRSLRIRFLRSWRAYKVHWDIGIDQDQGW
jgi:hypothetical protein